MTPINIEVRAQVDDAIRGLGQVHSSFNDFDTANRDAAGALGTFGISLSALNSPLTAVAGAIKDSIDTSLKWGATVEKLGAASGQTAQQASTMATVFGDFGIQTDSLDKVVKTFTKNGLQFNLDTIKELAVHYQSIQDPVERDKFAFQNFGRSALDMNEILSASPQKLDDLAQAAQYSGKVIDEQTVKSMEDFRLKAAELGDKVDGLKIQVGGPLVGVLSSAADGFSGVTATANALGIAIQAKLGIISYDEAAARADAAAHGDLFAEFKNITPVVKEQAVAIEHLKDDYVAIVGPLGAADAAVYAGTEDSKKAIETDNALAVALGNSARAAQDKADAQLLSAATSGTVTAADQTYQGVIDGNADKIAKLRDEIAKMTAANGETVTVVKKGTVTQEDYNLAVERAALALDKYTNHGKVSAQGLESLRIAAEAAQNTVDKMAGSMGSASSSTADYTAKIGDDQAALDKLTQANDQAAAALAKSTGQFILQQVAAAAGPEVQLTLAHALGLVDDKSYNLALNVQGLTKQWDLNHDGMISAGAEADGLAKALHGSQVAVEQAAGVVPKLVTHTDELAGSVATAAGNVGLLRDGINDLHDKTITITTRNNTYFSTFHDQGSYGGGAAGGADFVVPPGYPNDSFPLRVESGERVIVIPAGQGSNTTNNTFNFGAGSSDAATNMATVRAVVGSY